MSESSMLCYASVASAPANIKLMSTGSTAELLRARRTKMRYRHLLLLSITCAAMTTCSSERMTRSSDVQIIVNEMNSTTRHHRVKRGTSGSQLTYEERVAFLNAHNEKRKIVSPTAGDMLFMFWHEELAAMAQEWADGCEWKHGNPTRDPPPFSYIGQNLHATTTATVDPATAVDLWYQEVNDYNYDNNTCSEGSVCGHYTQVVWAKSNYLGCAIASCLQLVGSELENAKFTVCNYGPGGNIVGENPYVKADSSCTDCPDDTTCEDSLCVPSPKCGDKVCQNGGTLDPESCECLCVTGYDGANCTIGGDTEDEDDFQVAAAVVGVVSYYVTICALMTSLVLQLF